MPLEYKDGVLIVKGNDIVKVASALSSQVRFGILRLASASGKIDIDTLASKLGKSKANICTQIRVLEDAGLVKVAYSPGRRGVKKYCLNSIKEIRLIILEGGGGKAEGARSVASILHGRIPAG